MKSLQKLHIKRLTQSNVISKAKKEKRECIITNEI